MQYSQIIGLQFNDITRQEQEILVNSFVSGFVSEKITDFVVANKTESSIPCSNARQPRDNVFLRYGKLFKFGDIAVLDKEDFRDFSADIRKLSAHESYKEKNWIVFYDKILADDSVKSLDAIGLVLKPSQSAVPAAYQYIKAMTKSGCSVPLKVIIYGERYIEKAAEFFLGLKADLKKLSSENAPVEFAGFIFIPPEEKDLLLRFNTDIPRAFPKSDLHGQIVSCLRKITDHDNSIIRETQAERLLLLGC